MKIEAMTPIGITVGRHRYRGTMYFDRGIVSVYTLYGNATRPAGKSPPAWVAQALLREVLAAARRRGEPKWFEARPDAFQGLKPSDV